MALTLGCQVFRAIQQQLFKRLSGQSTHTLRLARTYDKMQSKVVHVHFSKYSFKHPGGEAGLSYFYKRVGVSKRRALTHNSTPGSAAG